MAGILAGDASTAGGGSAITSGKLEEPDHSSSNWYFAREEIERHSPSRKDSIDLKKETYFRKSYCTFLQDLGMRLKVPQVTIATAIVFCHRFFLRQSHLKNDRLTIATICMFLAGKVEETPRGLVDVILMSYEIRFKKDSAAIQRVKSKRQEVIEEQKELVLVGERLVLTTLGFDLNIHHPYKPLVAAIKKFKVAQNALAQVAWNFVNDGLRTSLCLQFKPHHIAAGAIFLAAKFLKVKLPSDGEKVWWQEFEVTPRQLEEVSNQMLELYEQNKAGGIAGPGAGSKSDPSISVGITKTGLATASHGRIHKVEDGPATSRMDDYEGHSARHTVGSTKTGQLAPSHERIIKSEEGPAASRMDDYEGHSGRHTPAAKSDKHANGVADTKMANGHHPGSRPSAAVDAEDGAASPRGDDEYEAHSARYIGSVSNPDKQNNGIADVKMEPVDCDPRQASGNGELKDGERHVDGELKVKSEPVSVKLEVVEEDRKSWGGLEDNKDKDSERSKHDRRGKAKYPTHRVEQMDALPERGEDGELPTTSAQEPSRSPRPAERRSSMTTSAERSASPSSQKRRWESREPHRGRDGGSHDKWSGGTSTYRHGGHNRNDGHYHHSNSYPHHQYRQEGEREQRYHPRDRDWERDHKKPRHEHGQY